MSWSGAPQEIIGFRRTRALPCPKSVVAAQARGYAESMALDPKPRRRLAPVLRALVEIGFIVFLFYSNLLMGEFSRSGGKGKTLIFALHDIVTGTNLTVALCSAMVGYLIVEYLRKRL
jgi:hypothetical protein